MCSFNWFVLIWVQEESNYGQGEVSPVYLFELVISVPLCLSPGSLHQSECEEERLSEHTESGRPAQRVFHHLLRHTHTHTHSASSSLQTDIHSTFVCLWTCTHAFTQTIQTPTSTILCCFFPMICLDCSSSASCELNDGNRDTLTGWMHLKERPINSPDLLPLWSLIYVCDNLRKCPYCTGSSCAICSIGWTVNWHMKVWI